MAAVAAMGSPRASGHHAQDDEARFPRALFGPADRHARNRCRRLLADKAYDADSLRTWLAARNVKAVIPSTAARRTPYPLDRRAYRWRNVIERLFGRLKNWRRIATRYDQHADNYLAAIALVAAVTEWPK